MAISQLNAVFQTAARVLFILSCWMPVSFSSLATSAIVRLLLAASAENPANSWSRFTVARKRWLQHSQKRTILN